MKNLLVNTVSMVSFAIVTALLSVLCSPLFAGEFHLEQSYREKAEAINEIYKEYQSSDQLKPTLRFPSGHPADAFFDTWAFVDDSFNIYVWRENGVVWIEIEPLSASLSFRFIFPDEG